MDADDHRVTGSVDLRRVASRVDGGWDKEAAREEFALLVARMRELQELLFADRRHALLVVLQAMDAAGKDSTVGQVFGPLNPQGCRVEGFKAPSARELSHDYLWRVHRATPARGSIAIFNRSHYEDVLVVRVHGLVPEDRWRRRYRQINEFERTLAEEGTAILKFYLHVSAEYQRDRFERRLARPDKQWKFNPGDLVERARWADYRAAYEEALERCSTDWAPWYVIPAERRWYRNLVIARTVVRRLEAMRLRTPPLDFDPGAVAIPDLQD